MQTHWPSAGILCDHVPAGEQVVPELLAIFGFWKPARWSPMVSAWSHIKHNSVLCSGDLYLHE